MSRYSLCQMEGERLVVFHGIMLGMRLSGFTHCSHLGKRNSPDIEDRVISLFKLGNNKHVLVFEDYVLTTDTSLE